MMQLGAPPRVITPALAAYVARTVTSPWRVLVGLALALGFVVAAPIASDLTYPIAAAEGVLLIAAAALYVGERRRRAQMRWLLEHAETQPARVIAVRDLQPEGLRADYLVTLALGDRRFDVRCRDLKAAKLEVDASEPVLWHASAPDVVVPTSLL